MSLKEKLAEKKQASASDVNFGKEVLSKLMGSVMFFEVLTMAACIAMSWGSIRVHQLPSIIGLGVGLNIILHAITLIMVNMLVTQSITEDLSSF